MDAPWIWQQPDWPRFRWSEQRLAPLLHQAHRERQQLLDRLGTLDDSLATEAVAALLSRESIGTAAIEGEQLEPQLVRSSVARRLQIPLQQDPLRPSPQVEGLVEMLLEATSDPGEPLTLERIHGWHRQLFAGGSDGLRSVRIGALRGEAPMQVVSGAASASSSTGCWMRSRRDSRAG